MDSGTIVDSRRRLVNHRRVLPERRSLSDLTVKTREKQPADDPSCPHRRGLK